MGEKNYPNIKISMGGGFKYGITFTRMLVFLNSLITLDDGEMPIELIHSIENPNYNSYKRTFIRKRKSSL
jgi:hypothetical protein